MEMKIIDVIWEGPFDLKYDRKTDEYSPPSLPKKLVKKATVYQIYGQHLVYGRNVLLYIGKTEQGVNMRLKEHLRGRFADEVELSVRMGTLYDENENPIRSKKWILAVESLLIVAHKPAMIRQYLDCPNDDAAKIHLRNWGLIGDILPECSGGYWEC